MGLNSKVNEPVRCEDRWELQTSRGQISSTWNVFFSQGTLVGAHYTPRLTDPRRTRGSAVVALGNLRPPGQVQVLIPCTPGKVIDR